MAIYPETPFTLKDGREVIFRSPQKTDVEAFQKFMWIIGEETIFTNQYPDQSGSPKDKIISAWADAAKNSGSLIVQVFDDDKIIANCAMTCAKPDHPWKKHISGFGLMTLKEYCNNGIASRLMDIIHDYVEKEESIKRLEAKVRATNTLAISLYLKKGYEIEGLHKNVALINGEMHHEYNIARLFE